MRKASTAGATLPPLPIDASQPPPAVSQPEVSELRKAVGKKNKGGRPARPPRCVVQVRYLGNGKNVNSFSVTVDVPFHTAIFRIQETFPKEGRDYRRQTDDPRWGMTPEAAAAIAAGKGGDHA